MKKAVLSLLVASLLVALGFAAGQFWPNLNKPTSLLNPLAEKTTNPTPLLDYSIENLRDYNFTARDITITEVEQEHPNYTSYKFSYNPLGQPMSGQLNIPTELPENPAAIIMVRGWVPQETYFTGMGTQNAASVFAENGYITLAPDFFGYGDSAPEPDDGWLARFQKPIITIELLKSIQASGVPLATNSAQTTTTNNIGFWAHSNGGQITLTALEILSEPYPATLWAPVVAPFPYSILFFSDEHPDEGKEFRQYVTNFEQNYDVFEFSLTQHLDLLTGPFQLHHGSADTAAPMEWSDEFIENVEAENSRREEVQAKITELEVALESRAVATNSASVSAINKQIQDLKANNILEPIEYDYFTYPGADHNLVPGWDSAVQRDLNFFEANL